LALLHGLEKGTEPPPPGPGLCYSVAIGHPKFGHSVEDFARQLYLDPLSVEFTAFDPTEPEPAPEFIFDQSIPEEFED
jgi:hypothetical protein